MVQLMQGFSMGLETETLKDLYDITRAPKHHLQQSADNGGPA